MLVANMYHLFCFMLAALEPNCSCALLPLNATLYNNGHGIRSASSQVNSKTFPIPPVAVQVIVLPLPRLIVCCGCIRCFLGCEYLFRKVYPIRYKALESGYWDARWDSNPRHRRMGNLLFYQLNYLRLTHQHKTFLAFIYMNFI